MTVLTRDNVGFTNRLGDSIQHFDTNAMCWAQMVPYDFSPHSVWMCMHQGELWTVHCEPGLSCTYLDTFMFVNRWDGAAWQEVGPVGVYPDLPIKAIDQGGSPSRPMIASDGTDVWIAYLATAGLPQMYIRRWDGTTWVHETHFNFILQFSDPRAGGAWNVQMHVQPETPNPRGWMYWDKYAGIPDSEALGVLMRDDGYGVNATAIQNTGLRYVNLLMAESGEILILKSDVFTNTIQVYKWDGAANLLLSASAAWTDLFDNGPTLYDAQMGLPSHTCYRADADLYYVLVGQVVFTVSGDGTVIAPLAGDKHYGGIQPEGSYAAPPSGSIAYDPDGDKIWHMSCPGSFPLLGTVGPQSDLHVFQPQCDPPTPTYPLGWNRVAADLLPSDAGFDPTQFGQAVMLYDDDKLYTVTLRCRTAGNPGGDSNAMWNGQVEVWETQICRDCFDCADVPPPPAAGGYTVSERLSP